MYDLYASNKVKWEEDSSIYSSWSVVLFFDALESKNDRPGVDGFEHTAKYIHTAAKCYYLH